MSNVFTFVSPSVFRSHTEIYHGSFTSSSQVKGIQPICEVTLNGRVLKLTSNEPGATPLITCHLEGWTKSRGKLYGSTAAAPIRQKSYFSDTWIIHDFEGNEYKWKYGHFWDPDWSLVDKNKNVYATFDIAGFKMHVLGRLTITRPVSKEFLDIILLTNRLVCETVRERNSSNASANSTF